MDQACLIGLVCCLFVGLPILIVAILNWGPAAAACTNLTCPANYLPKANMAELHCEEAECTVAHDARTCCDEKARCKDSAYDFPCPAGWFDILRKSSMYCRGAACADDADRSTCCDPAGTCPIDLSTHCEDNFRVSPAKNGLACRHAWCQQSECCSATCAAVGCGEGLLAEYLLIDDGERRFCADPQECTHTPGSVDVTRCCVARCSMRTACPEHFEHLNDGARHSTPCVTHTCNEPSDVQACCREHARCTDFATAGVTRCPPGFVPKAGSGELYCMGLACDHLGDADECCDAE